MSKAKKVNNEFEAKIKITNFNTKEAILDKINAYSDKYKTEGEKALYDIEKETSNMILLNFHRNTELANYLNGKLKLLPLENSNFLNLDCNLIIKIKNQNKEKEKQSKSDKENNEKKENPNNKNKNKIHKNDIYNIDTKNNQKLNKLLNKSLNFNKRNINKCINPDNNKLKIYESIFLGGPYLNKYDIIHKENRENKEHWLNKKGFVPYVSKNTIIKNEHMLNNILYKEPLQEHKVNFRSVEKTKWIGKHDFMAYS